MGCDVKEDVKKQHDYVILKFSFSWYILYEDVKKFIWKIQLFVHTVM